MGYKNTLKEPQTIRFLQPQLMYIGLAKEAMDLYVNIFNGKIIDEQFYPADHPTQAGQVLRATFQLGDQRFSCIDSPDVHDFSFTPSISIFVEMNSATELESVFNSLSEGGKVLMPVGSYGFSEKFVWFDDKFGVSWQLNYAGKVE